MPFVSLSPALEHSAPDPFNLCAIRCNVAAQLAMEQEQTADGWVRLALSARERGDHAGTLEAFQAALALVPDHRLLPVDIAYALFDLGRDAEACTMLQAHLASDPENLHAHVALGHHERRQARPESALEHFLRALQLEPASASLPIDVALLQEALGFPAEACITLQNALTHHPRAISLHRELARLSLAQGQSHPGLAHLRALVELEPEEIAHPLALAASLLDAGQKEEAEAMLGLARDALMGAPGLAARPASQYHRLGQLEQRQGRVAAARAAYTAGTQAEPSAIGCHLGLFWQAMDAPDPDRAEVVLEGAEAAGADALRVSMMRAHLLRAQGKLDTALECARSALTRQPDDVEAIAVTGELLWQQGHYAAAQAVLESLPSDSSSARGVRARHHARLALARFELETAQTLIEEAVHLLGPDAELMNLATRIALMRGLSEDALATLRARGALLQSAGLPASHPETVGGFNLHLVREYRVNPSAQQLLRESEDESPAKRVAAIAQVLREEPNHFGAAHQLLLCLRQANAFACQNAPKAGATRASSPIPRKIVQFWDQPEIPADILQGMLSWPQQCLGFEHQIFNDASAHAFIKRTCDKTVAKAYRQAHHPAMRADLFRLAYLAVEGGIYADADDICRRSIGDLLSPDRDLLMMQEDLGSVGNNFICARPDHPFIGALLKQAVDNVLRRQGDIIWFLTGPGAVTQRFCLYFLDALAAGKLPNGVHLMDFYVLQQRVSMHLPRAYKRGALHWTSPEAAPLPLFMPG